jgi:carboxyl-terminal processing protease
VETARSRGFAGITPGYARQIRSLGDAPGEIGILEKDRIRMPGLTSDDDERERDRRAAPHEADPPGWTRLVLQTARERGRRPAMATAVVAGAFSLGLLVGHGLPGGDALAEASLTGRAEFSTLEETWELIHEQWPAPDEIDDAALLYGAAKGMVDAIGDEGHSAFLDPEAAEAFEEASKGEYVGIGVEVDSRCGVPVVASTMEGSPAQAAGLLPGDIIAEVDDVSTRRVDTSELRDLILGNEGDDLTLTIERPGQPEPLQVGVVRKTIALNPVTWRWLPEKTAHLRVRGFVPGVSQKVRTALKTIGDAGATRLILDLRGNPGGLVPEVIGVASEFLDEGVTVFQEQGRDETRTIKTVGRSGEWHDLALVVLIDGESASGAEVLAAALRDNGRAELIGETTFGTGTVLSTFPQDDGSSVVLGIAFWLTPEGERVWREGVEPDQFVSLEHDAFPSRPEDDPQVTERELEDSPDAQLRAAFASLGEKPLAS